MITSGINLKNFKCKKKLPSLEKKLKDKSKEMIMYCNH
jgi:hypothetical protein